MSKQKGGISEDNESRLITKIKKELYLCLKIRINTAFSDGLGAFLERDIDVLLNVKGKKICV